MTGSASHPPRVPAPGKAAWLRSFSTRKCEGQSGERGDTLGAPEENAELDRLDAREARWAGRARAETQGAFEARAKNTNSSTPASAGAVQANAAM